MNKATRDKLPDSAFAGPNRSYPVQDKKHARLAISGASHAEHVGNISKSTQDKITARAERVLGRESSRGRKGKM